MKIAETGIDLMNILLHSHREREGRAKQSECEIVWFIYKSMPLVNKTAHRKSSIPFPMKKNFAVQSDNFGPNFTATRTLLGNNDVLLLLTTYHNLNSLSHQLLPHHPPPALIIISLGASRCHSFILTSTVCSFLSPRMGVGDEQIGSVLFYGVVETWTNSSVGRKFGESLRCEIIRPTLYEL